MIFITALLHPVTAQLQVEKIESNSGYTILQDKQILLPTNFNYSMHLIDLNQIKLIIDELRVSAKLLFKTSIVDSIEKLEDKFKTLENRHHIIKKRGLINGIGTIYKWIAGTMDDEDLQLINKHFQLTDDNNHQLINTINSQIQINDNFNTSINTLLRAIQKDRKYIENIITKQNDQTFIQMNKFDLRLKIQDTNNILTELQDNIVFSKLNIIHPSLLTHDEIRKYNIDSDKLKHLKIGFLKTTIDKLIFLIKIPFKMTEVNQKLIIPLSNIDNYQMIDSSVTKFLEYKNNYYEYDETKSTLQLNTLKHCIVNKNCKNIHNFNTEIINIEDSSLVVQLARNMTLTSDCDERKYVLNGNYYVKFYNCTLHLNNNTYYNNIEEVQNKYIIPHLDYKASNTSLSFNQILLQNKENIHIIHELKYYKPIAYSGLFVMLIIIASIISLVLYLYCKQQKNIIINKIQENLQSNEGRVTCTNIPTPNISISHKPEPNLSEPAASLNAAVITNVASSQHINKPTYKTFDPQTTLLV